VYCTKKTGHEITTQEKHPIYIGTEQNRFGWKTDKIAKLCILDGKMEFTILDGIWTKNPQMTN